MTFEAKMGKTELREVYRKFLLDKARKDDSIVVLEADLSSSMSTDKIKDELGGRYINAGIMEAQEVCCAAGLSVAGFKPYIHTFGPFASRRVFDQIFISVAYAGTNVTIIGSDAGVTAEANGGTHMPFEELSLLRSIPDAHVYEASDDKCLQAILEETYHTDGLNYVRMIRKNAIEIYPEGETFEDGYKLLREGSDVSIIASGIMVADALQAADQLAEEGISATVIDLYRVKPVNEAALLKAAETGAIVTAENHNVIGGIGSAVAETLAELKPTLQYRVGVREAFGQVGKVDYLKEKYGLTVENIVTQAKKLVDQKVKVGVSV